MTTLNGDARRWTVRGFLSAALIVVAVSLLVWAAFVFLQKRELPSSLVNSGLGRLLAGRYGVSYAVDSLRIGCGSGICTPEIEAQGIDLTLGADAPRIEVKIEHLDFAGEKSSVRGARVGLVLDSAGDSADLAIEISEVHLTAGEITGSDLRAVNGSGARLATVQKVKISTATGRSSLLGIRFPSEPEAEGLRVAVDEISVGRIGQGTDPDQLLVEQAKVTRVDVRAFAPEDGGSLCERLPDLVGALNEARQRGNSGSAAADNLVNLARHDARFLVIFAIVLFFGLKVFVTHKGGRWPAWLALGAPTIGVPISVFLLLGSEGRHLLLIGLGASAVLAGALWSWVYRHSDKWYQRWEPAAVDVAAVLILAALSLDSTVRSLGFEPPSNLRVDRVEIVDASLQLGLTGCLGPSEFQLNSPQTEITGIQVPVAAFLEGKPDFAISHIAVSPSSVDVASPAGRSVLTLSGLVAEIHDVSVRLDLDQERIDSFHARLKLASALESPPVREALRRVSFLQDHADALAEGQLALVVDLHGPSTEAAEPSGFQEIDTDGAQVAVSASVALDPAECAFRFDADNRVRLAGANIMIRADGDGETVHIRKIRDDEGFRLRVADASGTLSFGEELVANLGLEGIAAPLATPRLSVNRGKLRASIPGGCSATGTQALAVTLDEIGVETDDYKVEVARAEVDFDRRISGQAGTLVFDTRVRDVTVQARHGATTGERNSAPWLTADFPVASLHLSGQTSSETIPRHFDGQLDLLVARSAAESLQPADIAIGLDNPLQLSADTWDQRIEIPLQRKIIRQSIDPRLPAEVPFTLSLRGGLGSGTGGQDLEATFHSDWISFTLPQLPQSFEFNEIASLDLKTEGTLQSFPLREDLFLFEELPPLCPNMDRLRLNPFRIEGQWRAGDELPFLRLHGKDGSEIRVEFSRGNNSGLPRSTPGGGPRIGEVQSQIEKLSLPAARLGSLDYKLDLKDIGHPGNAEPGSSLSAHFHFRLEQDTFAFAGRTAGPADNQLIGFELSGGSGHLDFALTNDLRIDELLNSITPFVEPLGCDLSWITPRVRIQRLSAKAALADGHLGKVQAGLTIAPGSQFVVRFPSPLEASQQGGARFFREVEIATESDKPVTVEVHSRPVGGSAGSRTLEIAGAVPVRVTARDREGNEHHAMVDVETKAAGLLHDTDPEARPIIQRFRNAASDLRRHWENAQRIFGSSPSETPPDSLDLSWNLSLHDLPSGKPFTFSRNGQEPEKDELHFAIASPGATIAWKTEGQLQESRLQTSAEIVAVSRIREDHLALEGRAEGPLSISLGEDTEWQGDLRFPFSVALRKRLNESPSGTDLLWDKTYYEDFWRKYSTVSRDPTTSPLVNRGRLTIGPASIKQVLFPLEPLRLAVGHSERLGVNLPFSASLLYGRADGVFQTDIEWLKDSASASFGGEFSLTNFQAGALGVDSLGQHIPRVEDQLTSHAALLAKDLPLNRDTMQTILADASRVDGFGGLQLSLIVHRSGPHTAVPGVLQMTSAMETRSMNKLLNKILGNIRMSSPPRSVLYRDLDLRFEIENGKIQTKPLLVHLRGAQVFSTEKLEVEGDFRVHWQREGWQMPPYSFLNFASLVQRMLPADSSEGKPGLEPN